VFVLGFGFRTGDLEDSRRAIRRADGQYDRGGPVGWLTIAAQLPLVEMTSRDVGQCVNPCHPPWALGSHREHRGGEFGHGPIVSSAPPAGSAPWSTDPPVRVKRRCAINEEHRLRRHESRVQSEGTGHEIHGSGRVGLHIRCRAVARRWGGVGITVLRWRWLRPVRG
jgi:hypothetical protein